MSHFRLLRSVTSRWARPHRASDLAAGRPPISASFFACPSSSFSVPCVFCCIVLSWCIVLLCLCILLWSCSVVLSCCGRALFLCCSAFSRSSPRSQLVSPSLVPSVPSSCFRHLSSIIFRLRSSSRQARFEPTTLPISIRQAIYLLTLLHPRYHVNGPVHVFLSTVSSPSIAPTFPSFFRLAFLPTLQQDSSQLCSLRSATSRPHRAISRQDVVHFDVACASSFLFPWPRTFSSYAFASSNRFPCVAFSGARCPDRIALAIPR